MSFPGRGKFWCSRCGLYSAAASRLAGRSARATLASLLRCLWTYGVWTIQAKRPTGQGGYGRCARSDGPRRIQDCADAGYSSAYCRLFFIALLIERFLLACENFCAHRSRVVFGWVSAADFGVEVQIAVERRNYYLSVHIHEVELSPICRVRGGEESAADANSPSMRGVDRQSAVSQGEFGVFKIYDGFRAEVGGGTGGGDSRGGV